MLQSGFSTWFFLKAKDYSETWVNAHEKLWLQCLFSKDLKEVHYSDKLLKHWKHFWMIYIILIYVLPGIRERYRCTNQEIKDHYIVLSGFQMGYHIIIFQSASVKVQQSDSSLVMLWYASSIQRYFSKR